MSSQNIEQMIVDYAPILHFHHKEGKYCCYVSDAEEIYSKYSTDWLQFKETRTPSELNQNAPCYYEYWVDDELIQLRYWFWYNFNSFPGAPFKLGDHLGDWEHIEVRLFPNLERGIGVIWLYSNHLTARLASEPKDLTLPGFTPEQLILTDRHVHSWVALGSHAHYPSPNSRPYCFAKVLCDKISNEGLIWESWNNLVDISKTNFSKFTGRWGDEKAPRSPFNEYNNRWRNTQNDVPILYLIED